MSERHYSDDEIAAIFQAATEGPSTPPQHVSHADGLTLSDLQAIGHEVGIAPDAVAHAAQSLEVRQSAQSRALLGMPVGVERRVALGRRLTDDDWERLVVQLRDVFKARGKIKIDGSLRQWTNGNLYVLLEPTATGDRLRLGSVHGGAVASLRLAAVAFAVAAVLAVGDLLGAHLGDLGAIAGLLAGGAVLVGNAAFRLRGWARLRGQQMEDLAAQLAPRRDSAALPGSPDRPSGGAAMPDPR